MNPHRAYQQQRNPGQPRIDTILLLYETVIRRLEKALAAWRANDQPLARKLLSESQLGVTALASSFDPRSGDMALDFLRLYEFVGHCLTTPSETAITSALQVLRTLHEGLQEIRPEAIQMERSGAIPSLDQVRALQMTV